MRRKTLIKKQPKADLTATSVNKEEIQDMISIYKAHKNEEVPLRITDNLVILVSPDKCNDNYRKQYIKEKGILK